MSIPGNIVTTPQLLGSVKEDYMDCEWGLQTLAAATML